MNKNTIRITGLLFQMISVFLIIGGLYFPDTYLPSFLPPVFLAAGLILLAAGILLYTFLGND